MNILEKCIAVIIPSYNRIKSISKVIDSYLTQYGVKQIIIIDDCSSEDYSGFNAYMNKQCKERNLEYKYIKNKRQYGAAKCRNIGISICASKNILWGEDDLFLSNNYAEVLLNKLKENRNTIYFGSIYYGINVEDSIEKINSIKSLTELKKKDVFDYKLLEGYYSKKMIKDVEVPFGHAIIMAPKEIYENIKYFENYRVNGYREESDAQVQMIGVGYRVMYTSDTECYHLPREKSHKGGQHNTNRFNREMYIIINNNVFINRNYKILKSKFSSLPKKNYMKVSFMTNRIVGLTIKMLYKIIFKKSKV